MKNFIFASSLIILFSMCSCDNNHSNQQNDQLIVYEQPVKLDPESIVKWFLVSLSDNEFEAAFELQINSDWGDLTHFSSTNGFGGIDSIIIRNLELISKTDDTAIVFVEADYFDSVNGNNTYKQNFYLTKEYSRWRISKMELIIDNQKESLENNFDKFLNLFETKSENFDVPLKKSLSPQAVDVTEFYDFLYQVTQVNKITPFAKFDVDDNVCIVFYMDYGTSIMTNFVTYDNQGNYISHISYICYSLSNDNFTIETHSSVYFYEYDGNMHLQKIISKGFIGEKLESTSETLVFNMDGSITEFEGLETEPEDQ